jgi:hypothetical protein
MSLSADAIRQAAVAERDRLRATDRWAVAYAGAEAQEPLFVKTTPPVRDYFIVQFRQNDRTSGLMLVNPESARIGAITGIQKPGQSLFQFVRPEDVPPLLERHGRELLARYAGPDAIAAGGQFHAANVTVQPVLVWEACDQSLTPYYPFYTVDHTQTGRMDHFFVRVDGRVYTALTHGGRGM